MSEKINIDLVSINTKQAEASTKSLKQKIKELKDELANMDLESEEAKQKMAELGDAMWLQGEIAEQAKLRSADYGDQLKNVTSVAAGLVGAISSVNSVMTLMGVQNSEAAENLQKMTALMGLVQSLSTFDQAEKSFQALSEKILVAVGAKKLDTKATSEETKEQIKNTTAVNANTTAVNNQTTSLGKGAKALTLFKNGVKGAAAGLKAFALSNPFTMILLTISAAIAAIGVFSEKAKKAAVEAEKMKNKQLDNLYKDVLGYDDIDVNNTQDAEILSKRKRGIEFYKEKVKEITEEYKIFRDSVNHTKAQLEDARKTFEEVKGELSTLEHFWSFKSKEERTTEEGLKEYEEIQKKYLELYEAQYEYTKRKVIELSNDIILIDKEKNSELYDTKMAAIESTIAELEQSYSKALEVQKKIDTLENDRKKKEENDKKEKQEAIEKQRDKDFNDLKNWLSIEQGELELAYKKKEITEKEYLDRSLKINEDYQEKLLNLRYNKNVTELEKLQAKTNIENSKLAQAEYKIAQIRNRQVKEVDILVVDETKRLENDIETYKQILLENNAKIADLQNKNLREQQRLLIEADNATKEEKIAHINDMLAIELDYLEEQQKINEINYNNQKQYLEDIYNRDSEALKEELKLIKNEEDRKIHNDKIVELEKQHLKELELLKNEYILSDYDIEIQKTELVATASADRLDIERAEIEKRIELQQKYFDAYSNIYSHIGGLMSEIQNGFDSNSKEYKNIQKTMIIADTITGAMAAYKSGVQSGVPAPWNLVYGGTLAGLVTATGIAQLRNLENESIGTTSAANNIAANTNPYETLSYSTLSNIEGEIADSKVYVVESEIQAVGRRIDIYESEAMF